MLPVTGGAADVRYGRRGRGLIGNAAADPIRGDRRSYYDTSVDSLAAYLREHQFPALFIDGLGWDHAQGSTTLQVRDHSLDFRVIAQKRGVQVVVCQAGRAVLWNRGLLRRFQALVGRAWHEHVPIFFSEEPRKQVWQWAVRRPDGRRLRHREHP